jgi:hypothetical protein
VGCGELKGMGMKRDEGRKEGGKRTYTRAKTTVAIYNFLLL